MSAAVGAERAFAAASPERDAARRARLRACTILLVDDEEANLDLLEALLGGEGFASLVRTTDPREVPALVARHAPDLVLLDLHMPHRHGLDVLAELRAATPADEYRPVLVLTADATWEARERALARGASDFVTKPFETSEVLLRVENLLDARTLHAAERAARERAEAAEGRSALLAAERERILAVVAHDLRNPLGAVALYAEMLASLQPEDGDRYTRDALASIHRSAVTMQRLVEDLLDVAALRADALRIQRTEQRVGDAFDDAERMLRPLAAQRGLTLRVAPSGGAADARAPLDAPRVVQLLSNLVGNAIQFTPPGGVVTVAYAVTTTAVEGSVTDTGPGIPPEELPELFTPFRRRDRRDGHGTGLGLWIARAIVAAHDGELRVESRVGEGTALHFVLPFAATERRWED